MAQNLRFLAILWSQQICPKTEGFGTNFLKLAQTEGLGQFVLKIAKPSDFCDFDQTRQKIRRILSGPSFGGKAAKTGYFGTRAKTWSFPKLALFTKVRANFPIFEIFEENFEKLAKNLRFLIFWPNPAKSEGFGRIIAKTGYQKARFWSECPKNLVFSKKSALASRPGPILAKMD